MAREEWDEKRGKKWEETVEQGDESDEYVFGRSGYQAQGEEAGLRRSSRQPKPRFPSLEF